jgi:hypothetical protein
MSGSNTIPPIPLRFEGAENVQRTIDAIVARVGQLENAGKGAAASMGTLRTQAEQTGGAFRNTGQIIGQAGYQVQDFAVQVASGQSALTAFVQQGSQLAGIFGPGGAIAGAALAIGGIAAQFLLMGENAEEAKRRSEAAFKGMAEAAVQVRDLLAEVNALFLSANQNATNAANQALATTREGLLRQQAIAIQQQEGAVIELAQARRALAELQAGIDRRRAETFARTGSRVSDADRADVPRLAEALQRVNGAQAFIDLHGQRAGQIGESLARLQRFGTYDFSMPTPPVPPSDEGYGTGGGGGSRGADRDLDEAWRAVQGQQRDRWHSEDEESKRQEQERTRALEREEQANRRTTDRIVDYSANAFADLFQENSRGFAGMLDTFEKTAIRTFARIAAEAIIRPVVEPIVSSLGLGGLGSGNGGLSGLFGGTTAGASNDNSAGGGVVRTGLGTLSGGGSGGGGWLSSVGGFLSTPIWTSGGGWFGAPAVSAPSIAGMSPDAAMASLPETPTGATTGQGFGSTMTVGGAIASIGAGYMAGSAVGGYLAGQSKARQTNSQIGAAGGAMIGAVFGPVGAIAGGLIGGAAGGLIGPGKGFSGGDVGVAVDANGFLTLGNVGGKNWDGSAARNQTSAQLDQINQMLRASGLTIQGVGAGTLGYQGYGGSSRTFGPTEIWGSVRGGLTTSNSTLSAALSQGWMQSFEDLSVIAPYSAQNDNLTRALGSGGIRSRDDFNTASQWITGVYEPMVKAASITNQWQEALNQQNATYDAAIAKARELGLAESDLTTARDRAAAEVERQRNTSVHGALESLRIDELRAAGDMRGAAVAEYSLTTGQRYEQMKTFLTSNGIMEGSDLYQSTLARLAAVVDANRTSSVAQITASSTGGASGLMEELLYGSASGMTGAGRYAAGKGVLDTYRRSGDLAGYTAAASRFLPGAREYLGTSERYGSLVSEIRGAISALGGDPNGLLQDAQYRTADGVEALVRSNNVTNDELKAMRTELANLGARIESLTRRAA